MTLIDTHTHLYVEEFKDDIDSAVQRALAEGVEKFYLPAIDAFENHALLALEEKFPERMFAMAGLHPCSVKENFKEELEKINHQLYKIENFKGNQDDYYNPSNSLLNIVIKRKTGNPITLSILYIQLAHSVNFRLYPVNFPSHFMVKHVLDDEENEIIIDPFNEGRIMDDYSLKELLDHFYPKMNIALTRKLVDKASNHDVIIRMLNNLKTSFFECQDLYNAELVNEMILDINNDDQHSLRDKGMIFLHKKRYEQALEFFNLYLERFPEANDVDNILELIRKIKTSDL